MARHRAPTPAGPDVRRGRLADGDTVRSPGFDAGWTERLRAAALNEPTQELPMVHAAPALVRPYVHRRWWLRRRRPP
jgi:hypothetical protein